MKLLEKTWKKAQSTLAKNSWSRLKILIIGNSGSGKINALLNLINHLSNIDKTYLYKKD